MVRKEPRNRAIHRAWWPGNRNKEQTENTGRGQSKTDPQNTSPITDFLHPTSYFAPCCNNASYHKPIGGWYCSSEPQTPSPLEMPHSTPKGWPSPVFINLIRLTVKVILGYIASSVSKTNQAKILSKRDKLMHRIGILLMKGVRCLKKKVGSIPWRD